MKKWTSRIRCFGQMLRLGHLEWNVILVENFSASELCDIAKICKSIRIILFAIQVIKRLLISRKVVLPHDMWVQKFSYYLRPSCGRRYGAFKELCDVQVARPDGFRIFESEKNVVVLSDAYTFNVMFFNMCLHLEYSLGTNFCNVRYYQFSRRCCLNFCHQHISDIIQCSLEIHRGHLIICILQKECVTLKFIKKMKKTQKDFQEFVRDRGIFEKANSEYSKRRFDEI